MITTDKPSQVGSSFQPRKPFETQFQQAVQLTAGDTTNSHKTFQSSSTPGTYPGQAFRHNAHLEGFSPRSGIHSMGVEERSVQADAATAASFSGAQKDPPKEIIVMNVQLPNRAAPGNVKATWNADTKKIELFFQGKCGDTWEPLTPAKDGVSTYKKGADGMFRHDGPVQDGDKWDTKNGSQVFWQHMETVGRNAWVPQFNKDGTPRTQYIDAQGRIHLPIAAQSGSHSGIDGPSLSFIVERDGSMTALLLLEDSADASFNNKTASDKLIIEGNSPPFHIIENKDDPCNTPIPPVVPAAKKAVSPPARKKHKPAPHPTPVRVSPPPAPTKYETPVQKPHVEKPKPKPTPPPPPPVAVPTPDPVTSEPIKKKPEPKGWTILTGSPSYTPQRAYDLVSGNIPRSGYRLVRDAAELKRINPHALDNNGNFRPGVRINIDVKL